MFLILKRINQYNCIKYGYAHFPSSGDERDLFVSPEGKVYKAEEDGTITITKFECLITEMIDHGHEILDCIGLGSAISIEIPEHEFNFYWGQLIDIEIDLDCSPHNKLFFILESGGVAESISINLGRDTGPIIVTVDE